MVSLSVLGPWPLASYSSESARIRASISCVSFSDADESAGVRLNVRHRDFEDLRATLRGSSYGSRQAVHVRRSASSAADRSRGSLLGRGGATVQRSAERRGSGSAGRVGEGGEP